MIKQSVVCPVAFIKSPTYVQHANRQAGRLKPTFFLARFYLRAADREGRKYFNPELSKGHGQPDQAADGQHSPPDTAEFGESAKCDAEPDVADGLGGGVVRTSLNHPSQFFQPVLKFLI